MKLALRLLGHSGQSLLGEEDEAAAPVVVATILLARFSVLDKLLSAEAREVSLTLIDVEQVALAICGRSATTIELLPVVARKK